MAKIQVDSAFVEDVLIGNSGAWGLKTSEPHSKKNPDTGKWDTTGRTFRTVKVSRDSGIRLEQFTKGDRISFAGREVTEAKKAADGSKTFYDLVCWCDRIELAGSANVAAQPAAEPAGFANDWEAETPF